MSKLDQLLDSHRSAMEELNFPGLELNFNHWPAESLKKGKEYARAIRCFENSILMNHAETGAYHEDAHEHILANAGKIGHPHYLAYLEEIGTI